MSDAAIRLDLDDRGVATVVLDRPAKGNAYHAGMLGSLAAAWRRLEDDPGVRVVLLRGAGRHFCVGADLVEGATPAQATATEPAGAGLVDVCWALDRLCKPTVAVVHGGCIGGGLALAACCDVVVAEPDAFFSIPEVRIGFAPTPLTPFFLGAIGSRALRRYGQTGERFGAPEALRIGLVHVVAEPGAADAACASIVDHLLRGAPSALGALKPVIARVARQPTTPALLAELQAGFDAARDAPDAVEGRAAFREKRPPRWAPEA